MLVPGLVSQPGGRRRSVVSAARPPARGAPREGSTAGLGTAGRRHRAFSALANGKQVNITPALIYVMISFSSLLTQCNK